MTISAIAMSRATTLPNESFYRPKLAVFDPFTRADGNLNGSVSPSGHKWIVGAGSFTVTSNQAARNTADSLSMAYVETYMSDFIMEMDLVYDQFSGFVFRLSNGNNFWFARIGTTDIALWKNVNGTPSAVGTPYAFSPVVGTTYKIKVVAKGARIFVYLDGIKRIEATDSFNIYATNHGITTRVASSNPKFDNFSVKPVSNYYVLDSFDKASGNALTSSDSDINWQMLTGAMSHGSNGVVNATTLISSQAIAAVNTGSPDGTWRIRVNVGDDGSGITRNAGIVFRATDNANFWLLRVHRASSSVGDVSLIKYTAGTPTTIAQYTFIPSANTWYGIRVKAAGEKISAFLDNVLVAQVFDSSYITATLHGFRISSTTTFDTIAVDDFVAEKNSPLIAFDSFTRADNSSGVFGSSEHGNANWALESGDSTTMGLISGGVKAITVASNRIILNPSVGSKYAVNAVLRKSDINARLLGRYQDPSNEFYIGTVGSSAYALGKRTGGTLQPTFAKINNLTTADGDVLRLEVIDNLIRGYVNGVIVGQAIDTDLSTARKAGFMTASVGVIMDNFKVEEIPPQIIAYDDFNRVDSTTSLGSALTGQSWIAPATAWGIMSGKAYGVVANTADQMPMIDTGIYDSYAVTADVTPQDSASSVGIVLKGAGSANCVLVYFGGGGKLTIGRLNSGYTMLNEKAFAIVGGTTSTLRAEVKGDRIDVYVNGTFQLSTTENQLVGNTKQGIFKSSKATGLTDMRIDNFKVEIL